MLMGLQIPACSLLQRQIYTFYVCVFDYVYDETMMIFLLTDVDIWLTSTSLTYQYKA